MIHRTAPHRLLMIFAVALSLRAVCTLLFSGSIDTEGAEYASIAQNLLAGAGYVGIGHEGLNLFFPPLYPLLIAFVTVVTSDADISSRIVSVVMGALLVFPVYVIARRMYGERTALLAASLIALHPYLIQLSTTGHCEPSFMTCLAAAMAAAVYCSESSDWRLFALTGALYGSAYLLRSEALIYMLVGMAYILSGRILLQGHSGIWSKFRPLVFIALTFAIIATPYISWLSLRTGQLRLEAKSALNVETIVRVQQGMSLDEARMSVDSGLVERGVAIQPNIGILQSHHQSLQSFSIMVAKKSKQVFRDAVTNFTSNWEFGAPPLFVLAILGLFGRPWQPRLALDQLHHLGVVSISVCATFFIFYSSPRFYLLALVFSCIWASSGLMVFGQWGLQSAALWGMRNRWAGSFAFGLALSAAIIPSTIAAMSTFSSDLGTRPIKAWSTKLHAEKVADTTTEIAFYARSKFVFLPYCDEQTALRYLQKMDVTHVVLRSFSSASRPYLGKWMASGVPDARLVSSLVARTGEKISIYRITRN